MISIKEARSLLGETGKKLSDEEVEKLLNSLYALFSQIMDNNINKITKCKKQ